MNFAHPEKLWLLLVVPIVFLIAWVVHRRVLHRIGLFFGGDSAADVGGVVRRDHFWGRAVLTIVAMTFLLLSVAQPQWGFDWQEVRGRGASVFIALDLSQSMYAEDQKPNRLERARRKILDFLAMNTGARVGLIAFAGEALIQCPLTQDYEAVRMFLEQMSPNNMPIQGTSFSKVINLAVTTFTSIRTVADSTEALVILSDGEDHDPDINQALTEASSKGVRVFTLGFGTEEGSPIPQGGGGFKQDGSGSMVISRLQTSLLREIAEKTDGLYQRASIDDRDWHEIINRGIKENVSETEFAAGRRKQPIDRSFWFVLVGMILMCVQYFIGLSPKLLSWFLFAILSTQSFTSDAVAQEQAASATDYREAFKRGMEYYRQENFGEATKAFAQAAQSPDKAMAKKSLFNMGNSLVQENRLDEAVRAYDDAAAIDPKDKRIAENRSFVEQLKQQPEQPKQNSDNGQDKKNEAGEQKAEDGKTQDGKEVDEQQENNQPQNDQSEGAEGKENDKRENSDEQSEADTDAKGGEDKKEQQQPQPAESKSAESLNNKEQGSGEAKDSEQQQQQLSEQPATKPQISKDIERLLKGAQDRAPEVQRMQRQQQRQFNQRRRGSTGGKDW